MEMELDVRREELAKALERVAQAVRAAQGGEATLSFADGALTIAFGQVAERAAAEGSWPGRVRVAGLTLIQLVHELPERWETVAARVDSGRLYIGPWSAACAVDRIEEEQIRLPMNPPLTMLLALPWKYSARAIEKSGLDLMVKMAQGRRDALIGQAAGILQPLGVEVDDVKRLVEECVKRKNS